MWAALLFPAWIVIRTTLYEFETACGFFYKMWAVIFLNAGGMADNMDSAFYRPGLI
jgi:hypothetical protein